MPMNERAITGETVRSSIDKHGTAHWYNKGCRCDDCRAAGTKKGREARDRARAANSPSYQRELAVSREWKRRQQGHCQACGAMTHYSGRSGQVSILCRVSR